MQRSSGKNVKPIIEVVDDKTVITDQKVSGNSVESESTGIEENKQ